MWQAAVLALSAGILCTGCGGQADAPTPSTPPVRRPVGGPDFAPVAPPGGKMSPWESRVAARLGRQLRDDGLTLDHLACPRVEHTPARITCDGYVDGVLGQVRVRLSRWHHGAVEYDAALTGGVVSTATLVSRLSSENSRQVDCGSRPAYPARVGTRIVCAVDRGSGTAYVVATVTDRTGAVEIAER